jgi:predicted Zn-ribbon and HTH transcriptional regulator
MKRFEGLQEKAREAVLTVVVNSNSPLSVSQITKLVNAEDFSALDKKQFRQFIQNVTDRLMRHGELTIVKGTKSTGRAVNQYQVPTTTATTITTTTKTVDTTQPSV